MNYQVDCKNMKYTYSTHAIGDVQSTQLCGFSTGSDVTCDIIAYNSAGASPTTTSNASLLYTGNLVYTNCTFSIFCMCK